MCDSSPQSTVSKSDRDQVKEGGTQGIGESSASLTMTQEIAQSQPNEPPYFARALQQLREKAEKAADKDEYTPTFISEGLTNFAHHTGGNVSLYHLTGLLLHAQEENVPDLREFSAHVMQCIRIAALQVNANIRTLGELRIFVAKDRGPTVLDTSKLYQRLERAIMDNLQETELPVSIQNSLMRYLRSCHLHDSLRVTATIIKMLQMHCFREPQIQVMLLSSIIQHLSLPYNVTTDSTGQIEIKPRSSQQSTINYGQTNTKENE